MAVRTARETIQGRQETPRQAIRLVSFELWLRKVCLRQVCCQKSGCENFGPENTSMPDSSRSVMEFSGSRKRLVNILAWYCAIAPRGAADTCQLNLAFFHHPTKPPPT